MANPGRGSTVTTVNYMEADKSHAHLKVHPKTRFSLNCSYRTINDSRKILGCQVLCCSSTARGKKLMQILVHKHVCLHRGVIIATPALSELP